MTRVSFVRWFAVLSTVSGILLSSNPRTRGTAEAAAKQSATAPDPRRDMVTILQAMGPHPSLGDQANVFGRFVGTWDAQYAVFTEDGKATRFPGELVVGWVMDGHALQDLFISYPKAPGKERVMGTTLRYFDQKSGLWRVVFISPTFDTVIKLTGGLEGDRIVLRGQDTDGSELRWSFNEMQPNSFVWRGESSHDGGKTWWLQEEHHMTRRTAASVKP